jgi:hypothetical protein
MEIEAIKSNTPVDRHAEIVKAIKQQLEDTLDAVLFQAKLCKTVGDEPGLERFKKEATQIYNKIEAIDKI